MVGVKIVSVRRAESLIVSVDRSRAFPVRKWLGIHRMWKAAEAGQDRGRKANTSTNRETTPKAMNMTYCRRRPVWIPFRDLPAA